MKSTEPFVPVVVPLLPLPGVVPVPVPVPGVAPPVFGVAAMCVVVSVVVGAVDVLFAPDAVFALVVVVVAGVSTVVTPSGGSAAVASAVVLPPELPVPPDPAIAP